MSEKHLQKMKDCGLIKDLTTIALSKGFVIELVDFIFILTKSNKIYELDLTKDDVYIRSNIIQKTYRTDLDEDAAVKASIDLIRILVSNE